MRVLAFRKRLILSYTERRAGRYTAGVPGKTQSRGETCDFDRVWWGIALKNIIWRGPLHRRTSLPAIPSPIHWPEMADYRGTKGKNRGRKQSWNFAALDDSRLGLQFHRRAFKANFAPLYSAILVNLKTGGMQSTLLTARRRFLELYNWKNGWKQIYLSGFTSVSYTHLGCGLY